MGAAPQLSGAFFTGGFRAAAQGSQQRLPAGAKALRARARSRQKALSRCRRAMRRSRNPGHPLRRSSTGPNLDS
jgi:hypothetical protein